MGGGLVSVGIEGPGAWTMSLRGLDGSLVDQRLGLGAQTISLSRQKRGQGVYLLEVKQGGASLARTLAL
jgi:hypothetical protein